MSRKLEEFVFQSPIFQVWKKDVESTGTQISKIDVLSVISRSPGKLFSVFIDTEMITPEGERVPRCMLLRGKSVVIVPVVHCDDGETYTLMIKQRRPVDGSYVTEFPGGMCDSEDESPASLAIREIQEELGLSVKAEDLKPLQNEPIKVCTGMLDEQIYFFYFETNISQKELANFDGSLTGHHHDGEFLVVQVVKMSEVTENLNCSALVGIKLLEKVLNRNF